MAEQHDQWPDPYTSRLIRRKAGQICERCGLSESHLKDMEQELRLHLFTQLERHDPDRGGFHTFAKHVIENKAVSIIRHCYAGKRRDKRVTISIDNVLTMGCGEEVPIRETIPSPDSPPPDGGCVDDDIAVLLAQLDSAGLAVATGLMKGHPECQIRKDTGLSRSGYAHTVGRIRDIAQDMSLQDYL